MFTGIIKTMGRVSDVSPKGGDLSLTVQAEGLEWKQFELGESIAVNGVCLTAVRFLDDGFVTDVSRETLDVTALGDVVPGSAVNLESALALGERLGGHLVSGHVDCIGVVRLRQADARSIRFDIEIPDEYSRYVARKGSVCVDGVSLTVNEISGRHFSVNIIPHTAECTIIDSYRVGTRVNVEVDMLARYLERLLVADDAAAKPGGVGRDFLETHGYA